MSSGRGPKRGPSRRPAARSSALPRASTASGSRAVRARAAVFRKSGCAIGETGAAAVEGGDAQGAQGGFELPQRPRPVCRSTGTGSPVFRHCDPSTLPPRARATTTGGRSSGLVVELLFLLDVVEIGVREDPAPPARRRRPPPRSARHPLRCRSAWRRPPCAGGATPGRSPATPPRPRPSDWRCTSGRSARACRGHRTSCRSCSSRIWFPV